MLLDHWKHHLSSHKILTAGLDFLVPDRCDVHCEREHSVVGPTSGQCSSQLALEGSQPNGLILSFEFHAKRKSSSQTFSWPSLTVQGRSLDSNGAVFLEFFLSKCGRPELKQAVSCKESFEQLVFNVGGSLEGTHPRPNAIMRHIA
ncbi:hypothetical protein PTI98_002878 [Pleurotus ostreatus]|nr:hypothetical protein PTI98_002878 [Pleurotus ostreatus]